jgi:hypothetical protein
MVDIANAPIPATSATTAPAHEALIFTHFDTIHLTMLADLKNQGGNTAWYFIRLGNLGILG